MNRDTAIQHIKNIIDEVAADNGIPESIAYAAMDDELFVNTAVARLFTRLPENPQAGSPETDLAAAEFAEELRPEVLVFLQRRSAAASARN